MSELTAVIDKLAFGGNGVCRINGKVCFVPFSCPGDEARLAVTAEKRSYCVARIVELIVPSSYRVPPPCPIFGKCGGCSWQHIEYGQQLVAKQQILAETLWRGARIPGERIRAVVPSPSHYSYRSRVQFKLHGSANNLHIGFFRNNSHRVEDVGRGCAIALPVINASLAALRKVLQSFPEVSAIPRISIDTADNEVIAIVTYLGSDSSTAAAFFRERRADLTPVTGVFLQTGHKPLMNLYGADHLTYSLPLASTNRNECRLTYQPGGFSQVNRGQNRALLDIVRQMACFQGNEQVLDLYCGNGNFSLPIAAEVAAVTGIEESGQSIEAAEANRSLNGITNADFIRADAVAGLKQLVAGGRHFDTVILDPPRSGAADVVSELYRLDPASIIYISCDPSTLARDCGLLANSGYRVQECVPVDMFPQTYHLESVTLLQKL
ncbi:MAG: 23S rRNA (uracil(1939)-C(5))-methyltransferase RlmD [Desulfobacteraceae bacterium]|nr:23S rRNA (uracil(1939)-C(5))-methyltransferase RlmD [Desulfobacteraceae bacterium]